MGRRNWTQEEVDTLDEFYSTKTNIELADMLNRDINSIQHKANKLGLHKAKDMSKIYALSRSGEKCCNWKGGRKITTKGYVQILVKGHPYADSNGYIFEHRYIMEQYLGRYLRPNEVVHHKNGNKQDNRIENLELMTNSTHSTMHDLKRKVSQKTKDKISVKAKERLKNKHNHPLYKNIDVNELMKLKSEGKSIKEICSLYNICKRTFYNKINEYLGGQIVYE